jgi:iron-sulfur cluster protein
MSRHDKAAAIRRVMESEGESINRNTTTVNQLAGYAIEQLESYEELRDAARATKESAIEELPDLIDEVTETVEANGGTVYLAQDADDANRYIERVMAEADGDHLAKSKSMTTEELDLNDHLEEAGYEVTETDLGEFVIQVADEAPSHLIGPAMHKSTAEIADLFNAQFDLAEPLSDDPQELTAFAREEVGRRIRDADVGLTGANFVVAESGTICLVTNEGNARKTAVTPPTHVAVTGIEKLVPELTDLQPFVELIARTGTGQDLTSYLSLLTPPVETPAVDFEAGEYVDADDREFHLVLLDNGRMAMREDDQLRETLYCIRCGACANACANFQSVGGHAFGGETYTGGIGTGWEAGVHGLDAAADMNDLCTGCSRCVEKCPVKIDIPWINTVVRDRLNHEADSDEFDFLVEGLVPDEEPGGLDLQKRFFGNFETAAKLGSTFPRLSNALADSGTVRSLLDRTIGVDPRRDLPTFAPETFREWFAGQGPFIATADADREVVLYADAYTNYFDPDRGKAAVRTLEALGCSVRVPPVPESGRAPLSQGMIDTADECASEVYAALAEHIDAGRDVVVVEPSDIAMFRGDYERLLPEQSAERLAENSYEIFEYVYGLLENGADIENLATVADGRALTYHSHCQQRTLGLEPHTVAVLEEAGYDVTTTDAECCGMAGSFGYKSEYYELSVDVGERLLEDLDDGPVVASGTSCCEQVRSLTDRSVRHPVELLDPT